jgi:hypothetical protein
MPDKRAHRGPHPKDERLFAPGKLDELRRAGGDYGWLLSRGYSSKAALTLVGDRYQLLARQRMALLRGVVAEHTVATRNGKRLSAERANGRGIAVDGFNCLITVEVALSGGVLLLCLDGVYRDLASVHGTYRRVAETRIALALLTSALDRSRPASVTWYLDKPISNSAKLAGILRETFSTRGLDWRVALVANPDREIAHAGEIAASSDGGVLDSSMAFIDLAGEVITREVARPWVVDLRADSALA